MGLEPGEPGYLAESRQPMLYAVSYTMLGLATAVLALLTYCRIFLIRVVQVFDYVMLVAFIDIVVMHAMIHMQIKTGMGRHIEYSELHPDMHEESKKVGYVQNICYQSALGFIKSSILLQYLSIATGARIQRWAIYGLITFVIIFSILTTISAVLLYIPISNTWNADKFPKGCWNTATFNFITSGINTATDIVIYILPLPVLVRLKMNKRKKYALIAIFCLAFIAVGASLGRLSSLVAWDNSGDITYDAATIPIWDAVETDVAVAAISLPLLRPLFRYSSDTAPTMSDISSRIMRNWTHHARSSSLQFLAGNGGSFVVFSGGRGSSASGAAAATATHPATRFQMGWRTSSSDDTIAYSIELADGRDCEGKGGKNGIERVRKKGSGEYEEWPFGEVLVTRTVLVDEERRNDDRNLDFVASSYV